MGGLSDWRMRPINGAAMHQEMEWEHAAYLAEQECYSDYDDLVRQVSASVGRQLAEALAKATEPDIPFLLPPLPDYNEKAPVSRNPSDPSSAVSI